MSEVTTVLPKRRSTLIKPSLVLELVNHATMGVASGLAFAFLVTHIGELGVANLISYSPPGSITLVRFVGTCAAIFGIGAILTGLVISLTEDDDTSSRK